MMEMPITYEVAPGLATPRFSTWAGFLLMCLGMFMAILDIQVVATSLPTIQRALTISPSAMSWIQTAYLIAEVIAIPLTGLLTHALRSEERRVGKEGRCRWPWSWWMRSSR